MRPQHLTQALTLAIDTQQPAFLWGSPGIGKSAIVKQVASEKKLPVRDVRAALLDPVDLRGIPVVRDGKTTWTAPEFLPTEGAGLLFLDELNAAPPLVQAACYQLVLDRALGEYTLPDGWTVIAAGNLESDRAVTSRMSTALSSRFLHLELDIHLDDWSKWAFSHEIRPEIVAFVRFRPELLHKFDPRSGEKSFPCPRTWEFTSKILNGSPAREIEYEMLKGIVGEAAAAEFTGFLRIFRDLPSPDAILLNPEQADVPTDPATLYALCGALARKASDNTADRLFKYFRRLPAEFGVMAVRDSVSNCKDVAKTRSFIEWASDNSEILI
jgi:hypothetical protein